MSHRGVEIVLGRLVADEAARRRFSRSPRAALRELVAMGIELNSVELSALEAVDPRMLERFASTLDPRLLKVALDPEHEP